ncbi:hypothetical protein [Halorussus pelagicus]|uniref:hypothetical protein n=1 Tax=Halorussus pelagicus TaxID=2505977 RepID=UPI000FFC5576|nr:hypothetical protein [Halorussus pelagicus]
MSLATGLTDGFEDDDLGAFPSDWAGDSAEVVSSPVHDGTRSVNVTGGDLDQSVQTSTANASAWLYSHTDAGTLIYLNEDGNSIVNVGIRNGDLVYYDGSWTTIATTPGNNEWVWVNVRDIDPSSDTATVEWMIQSGASGSSTVNFRNDMTNGYDTFQIQQQETDVGTVDAVDAGTHAETGLYVSDNHTATNAKKAWTNLSISNATATVEWQAWTGTQWQVVDSSTFSNSGNKTVNISGADFDSPKWRVDVTLEKTGSNPTAELHDEGMLVETDPPTADTVNATPANGNGTSGRSITVEVPVNDTDFGKTQGDSVDASLILDGVEEATTTLASNGTASVSVSNVSGGTHSYHWILTDSYGHTVSTDSLEFKSPLILHIHDGDNRSALVTSEIDMEIIETNGDFRETRSVSDGTAVVGAVPDTQLKIRLTADEYQSRRMLINHPYSRTNRHTVLLNKSDSQTFQQCFEVNSQSAGFEPADTWLVLESYIDGEWRDAAGTYFGSTNYACVGVTDGEEYRLIVNEGSKSKDLGGYTADSGFANQILQLNVRSVDVGVSAGTPYAMSVRGSHNETTGEGTISITFASHDQSVSDLELLVYQKGNESNVVFEKTVYGTVETYAASVPIDANETDETFIVEWSATEGTNKTISGQQKVNVYRGSVETGLGPMWQKVGYGSLILLIGGLFGPISAPIGSVVTASVAGALWYSGVLDLRIGVILYAGSVGLAFYLSSRMGGR